MNRKFAIFAILVAALFIGLPMETSASSAVKETTVTSGSVPQILVVQQGRRSRRGYWRNGRYYRNYGQYRRTQVGWRRGRMMNRQYYWRDGRRVRRYERNYNYR